MRTVTIATFHIPRRSTKARCSSRWRPPRGSRSGSSGEPSAETTPADKNITGSIHSPAKRRARPRRCSRSGVTSERTSRSPRRTRSSARGEKKRRRRRRRRTPPLAAPATSRPVPERAPTETSTRTPKRRPRRCRTRRGRLHSRDGRAAISRPRRRLVASSARVARRSRRRPRRRLFRFPVVRVGVRRVPSLPRPLPPVSRRRRPRRRRLPWRTPPTRPRSSSVPARFVGFDRSLAISRRLPA